MCESFSPMNLAEDCLKARLSDEEEEEESSDKRGEKDVPGAAGAGAKVLGVEVVAQAIDSVISRVKMTLKNTTVRLEFVPDTKVGRGLALEVKVATIMFAGGDNDNQANNLREFNSENSNS